MLKFNEIHPNLQKKSLIIELNFCFVLLEDNKILPWIFLVPKKNVKNMLSLTSEERILLMKEIEICEKAMFDLFNPDQTNIAMIGNKTPHLHVHIICRKESDAAWPEAPFHLTFEKFNEKEKQNTINKIHDAIKNFF